MRHDGNVDLLIYKKIAETAAGFVVHQGQILVWEKTPTRCIAVIPGDGFDRAGNRFPSLLRRSHDDGYSHRAVSPGCDTPENLSRCGITRGKYDKQGKSIPLVRMRIEIVRDAGRNGSNRFVITGGISRLRPLRRKILAPANFRARIQQLSLIPHSNRWRLPRCQIFQPVKIDPTFSIRKCSLARQKIARKLTGLLQIPTNPAEPDRMRRKHQTAIGTFDLEEIRS